MELQALDHRWGQAEDGEGQVVLISGEPGIGKSRIAETIHERLPAERHLRLLYQCSPHHTHSALRPIIEQLSFAAGLDADEPDDTKLDKLEALIAQAGDDVSATAPLFADLLSIRHDGRYPALNLTPQAKKERTLEALVAQLKGLAARTPVLFVFEDLHWADPTTREFLDLTVKAIEEARVLVLFTFRPEYEAPWVGQSHATLIALNRLSKRQCGEMAKSVAFEDILSNSEIDEIVAKTDGVPLFVEELTKTLLGGDSSETVPATIQASLTARLDHLGPAREVAQVGAVIGRTFSYELIGGVSEAASDDIDAALIKLEESGLAIRRGAPPHASYTFKHALVQDAAYESLLKSARRSLHARVAETLEAISPNIAQTQPELLAHHFGEAGVGELAVRYWRRATERASERSASVEAINHAGRGLKLLDAIDDEQDRLKLELDLQVMLGNALLAMRGYSAAETGEAFRRAYEICQNLGEKRRIFPVLIGLHGFHDIRGEFEKATVIGQEALELAQGETQHVAPMATALFLRGENSFFLGKQRQAAEYFDALDEIYDLDGPRISTSEYSEEPGICGNNVHAWMLALTGYADKAREKANRTIEAARKLQHPHTMAFVNVFAIWVALERGEIANYRRLVENQLALCEEQRLAHPLNMAIFYKTHADSIDGGDAADIDKMLASAARLEDQFGLIFASTYLTLVAAACTDRGLQSEGLDACRRALEIVEQTGERHREAETHRVNGLLLAPELGGDAKPAEECFMRALEVARSQPAKTLELRAARDLARLWHEQGRSDEARDLLAPVYDWFTEGFDTADLMQAKALLDALG